MRSRVHSLLLIQKRFICEANPVFIRITEKEISKKPLRQESRISVLVAVIYCSNIFHHSKDNRKYKLAGLCKNITPCNHHIAGAIASGILKKTTSIFVYISAVNFLKISHHRIPRLPLMSVHIISHNTGINKKWHGKDSIGLVKYKGILPILGKDKSPPVMFKANNIDFCTDHVFPYPVHSRKLAHLLVLS